MFEEFTSSVMGTSLVLPLCISHVALFVAYLHHQGSAPKTISTYLSAISYAHKISGYSDPTQSFIIHKLTAGAYRLRPVFDLRLPITVPILDQLIRSLQFTTANHFDCILYQSMFLFAFESFARIGEITTSEMNANSVIQYADISFHTVNGLSEVEVRFRHFKHNLTKQTHIISFGKGYAKISAVKALAAYVELRGQSPGPLFCSVLGKPVNRSAFDQQLHRSLGFCRLDSSRYKGHSFRIGAATHKAQMGYTDAMIRSLGRWSSNAFRKYIRIHTG